MISQVSNILHVTPSVCFLPSRVEGPGNETDVFCPEARGNSDQHAEQVPSWECWMQVMLFAQEEHPAVICSPLSAGLGVKHLLCKAVDTTRKVINSLLCYVQLRSADAQKQKTDPMITNFTKYWDQELRPGWKFDSNVVWTQRLCPKYHHQLPAFQRFSIFMYEM